MTYLYICSHRTYSLLEKMGQLGKFPGIAPDMYAPDYTKLRGRGRKKLFGLVYEVIVGVKVNSYLISDMYDWRKERESRR